MDRTARIQRVVEIQRMTHAGVQQRRLRRRQADAAQQDAAFRQPAPARDDREEFVDPRGAAAAEHAAKGVENVAAGGFDGACRQIRVAGAANVPGQRPGGVVGHCLLPPVPMLHYDAQAVADGRTTVMLRLYYAPGTCALATHIALEEAGAPYEAVLVDFRSQGQRSPEYLAINPKGRVPALVTENGTLTETPALLCFVAQLFPQAELAPFADPFAFARVQEFNSYLCSTVHVAHAHRMRGARWADDAAAIEAMKRKVPSNATECYALIEHKLLKGPWVMGERYTICDPYLFTLASWIEGDGVDTAKLPRVMEHRRRMLARPAVQKAVSAEGARIP
ncbi:MAG TPA: glutathione S-transferase family protein [Stellaceae bacterium]|nr:glutathione S-transferase family protein [Stellaceae bacterium]